MAYEKTTWNCGDTITAEKLNNLENGVEEALECCSGGGLICTATVTVNEDNYACYILDKTWQEIHDALAQGQSVYISEPGDNAWNMIRGIWVVVGVYDDSDVGGNDYDVAFIQGAAIDNYNANSPSAFPHYTYGE